MEEVALSTNEFKALSSKTRTGILKILDERNYTLSELAAKTSMTPPTVKQHTTVLMDAGLIELRDEGRKWKYYNLTRKGKNILNSNTKGSNTNFLIILSTAGAVALIGLAMVLMGGMFPDPFAQGTALSATTDTRMDAFELESGETAKIMPATEEAAFNCVPAFEIETNTNPSAGITASEAYAQDCYKAKTKEACENIDLYSTETRTFGTQDGNPDCKWETAKFDN